MFLSKSVLFNFFLPSVPLFLIFFVSAMISLIFGASFESLGSEWGEVKRRFLLMLVVAVAVRKLEHTKIDIQYSKVSI